MRLSAALAAAAAVPLGAAAAAAAVPFPPPLRASFLGRAPTTARETDAAPGAAEPRRPSVDDSLAVAHVRRIVVVHTTTRTTLETVTLTGTVTPTTAAPFTQSCDLRYCNAGTSYCAYWGGYSSFDVSQGRPIPGETRTSIGVCTDDTFLSGSLSGSPPGPSRKVTPKSSSGCTRPANPTTGLTSSSRDPLDSITITSTIQSLA